MRVAKKVSEVPVIFFAGLMLALDGRKLRAQNQQRPEYGERSQKQVGLDHAQRLGSQVGVIDVLGLERVNLRRSQFHTGENEYGADQDPGDRAQRVEGLREIETPFRTLGISQLCNERIGGSFQKRKTAGNHEKRHEEKKVLSAQRCRPEQETSQSVQEQPSHKTRFVPESAHQQSRGDGQQKVPQVESRLHQPRLEPVNRKRLHELPDQDIVQIIGNSPQKEQRRHQNERKDVSRWKKSVFFFSYRRKICRSHRRGSPWIRPPEFPPGFDFITSEPSYTLPCAAHPPASPAWEDVKCSGHGRDRAISARRSMRV